MSSVGPGLPPARLIHRHPFITVLACGIHLGFVDYSLSDGEKYALIFKYAVAADIRDLKKVT